MGILTNVMKKNAVVLQKPSGTIAIRVDLDVIQRKLYDALLYIAKENLRKKVNKEIFSINLSDLKLLLNKISKEKMDKNNKYYAEKLKELKNKNAEYNILDKDAGWEIEGWVSLMSELQVKKEIKTGQIVVVYDLPNRIRKALLDPKGIYANINLVVIRGLNSKYAIILYELVKDYEKVEIPEMTMEEFRKIFNIEGKYEGRIDHVKDRVLDAAVSELNDNENIDFLVSYELRKTGKYYTHIKFHVKPKPAKLKLDQQKDKIITQEIQENPDLSALLALVPEKYRAKKNLITIVLGGLEEKGKEYIEAEIEYTNKNAKKNYIAFLKKAIESDYAGVNVIEGAEIIIENNDWKKKYIGKKIKFKGEEGIWEIIYVDEPDDDGKCKVRAKNNNGRELWAVIKIDNPLLK